MKEVCNYLEEVQKKIINLEPINIIAIALIIIFVLILFFYKDIKKCFIKLKKGDTDTDTDEDDHDHDHDHDKGNESDKEEPEEPSKEQPEQPEFDEKEYEEWNKMVEKVPPIPESPTKDKDLEEWALRESEASKVYKTLLKNTHEKCPVMNSKTKISVCIQHPKTNTGYVVSVCCPKCITAIQTSLNSSDNEYEIIQFKDIHVLVKKGIPKQVVPVCNEANVNGIMKLVGTELSS